MNFPSKPWTNGQSAELSTGNLFTYDASKGVWLLTRSESESSLRSLIDSDYSSFNSKFSVVDGQIAAVNTSISNVNARLDSDYALVNGKVSIIDAAISALQNVDNTILARLDSDSTIIQDLQTQLNALGEGSLADIIARANADSDALAAVDARLATAEGEIDTLQGQMSAVLTDASDNAAQIAALYLEADSDATRIADTADQVIANGQSIAGILADLDSDGVHIQQLRIDLEAEIAATNVDLAGITARLDSDEIIIQDLQTQLDALGDGNLGDILADHDSDFLVLAARATTAEQRLSANEFDINQLQTEASDNATDIATNAANIATNVTDIASNAANIATNTADIATNSSAIATNAANITTNYNQTQANIAAIAVERARITALASDNDSDSIQVGRIWKQATAPANPNINDMWWDTGTSIWFAWDSVQSVWVQTL